MFMKHHKVMPASDDSGDVDGDQAASKQRWKELRLENMRGGRAWQANVG